MTQIDMLVDQALVLMRDFGISANEAQSVRCVVENILRCANDNQNLSPRIIKNYNNQPAGCSGVRTLTFAQFESERSARPESWVLRIPFARDNKGLLMFVFPTWFLRPDHPAILKGADPNFRAEDGSHFLANPRAYLNCPDFPPCTSGPLEGRIDRLERANRLIEALASKEAKDALLSGSFDFPGCERFSNLNIISPYGKPSTGCFDILVAPIMDENTIGRDVREAMAHIVERCPGSTKLVLFKLYVPRESFMKLWGHYKHVFIDIDVVVS